MQLPVAQNEKDSLLAQLSQAHLKRQAGPAFRPVETQKRPAFPLIQQMKGATVQMLPPLLQSQQTLPIGHPAALLQQQQGRMQIGRAQSDNMQTTLIPSMPSFQPPRTMLHPFQPCMVPSLAPMQLQSQLLPVQPNFLKQQTSMESIVTRASSTVTNGGL